MSKLTMLGLLLILVFASYNTFAAMRACVTITDGNGGSQKKCAYISSGSTSQTDPTVYRFLNWIQTQYDVGSDGFYQNSLDYYSSIVWSPVSTCAEAQRANATEGASFVQHFACKGHSIENVLTNDPPSCPAGYILRDRGIDASFRTRYVCVSDVDLDGINDLNDDCPYDPSNSDPNCLDDLPDCPYWLTVLVGLGYTGSDQLQKSGAKIVTTTAGKIVVKFTGLAAIFATSYCTVATGT